ncbi:MAG: CPBP family intramembrane metalloprotease [Leptospirales bacterium]|nr:CPBP family intramembrane metalloprotease [Leptospirales bacterium]
MTSNIFKGILFLAVVLFLLLFLLSGDSINFWYFLSANNIVLCSLIFYFDREYISSFKEDVCSNIIQKIVIGIGSALALYVIFYVGNIIAPMIIPNAGEKISTIYDFKSDQSFLMIALLVTFISGPGEEILWRGFVQRHLQGKGLIFGYVFAAIIYSGVHITSFNIMLILAALVCGGFWGLLYLWKKSIVINIISHTVWVLAAFILFPFR